MDDLPFLCRGYMAPEYLARGQLTEKADVYSFGVLLLEIVTGRQNNKRNNSEYTVSLVSDVISDQSLLSWTKISILKHFCSLILTLLDELTGVGAL